MSEIPFAEKFHAFCQEDEAQALAALSKDQTLANLIWPRNDKFKEGSTPLHWAAHNGFFRLMKELMK